MPGLPLTSPSPTNNQPALWVLSFLYAIYAFVVLGIRYAMRRKFQPSDQVLIGGYVLGLVNWALLWTALSKGLAKATSVIAPGRYTTISQLVFGGVVTLLLAQACAMASQCLFIGEYLPTAKQRRPCYVAAGVTGALSIAAVLSTLAGCEGTSYLNTGAAGCSEQSTRWVVTAVLLALASCVPAALSVYAFHKLQTRMAIKIKLYLAFSSSLFNIPLLAGIAGTARAYYAHGRDSLDAMPWLVCLQTLLLLSFIAASMPCAPRIALKFTTAGLVFIDEATSRNAQSAMNSKSGRMSTMGFTNHTTKSVNGMESVQPSNNGVTHFQNNITGGTAGDEANSVISFGSERHIIRKTVKTDIAVHVIDS